MARQGAVPLRLHSKEMQVAGPLWRHGTERPGEDLCQRRDMGTQDAVRRLLHDKERQGVGRRLEGLGVLHTERQVVGSGTVRRVADLLLFQFDKEIQDAERR